MTVYNIITAICFALLILCIIYVVITIATKRRADRIEFIRGFKRGKCILIFLIAIPLLCLGYMYDGANFFDGILNSISHVIDFVVLKFGLSKVETLLEANLFYKITVYFCCVLVILNAMLFAFSFIGQQIWQVKNTLGRVFTRKEKLFIIGNNEDSIAIYYSNKAYYASIVDKISNKESLELYKRKIKFISLDNYKGLIGAIIKGALKNKNYIIVINSKDDETNLALCNLFIDQINFLKDSKKQELFNHLRIYVFGDSKYEAVYCDTAAASYGCIRYKNKYQMLAMDFIDKYPFTKFMDDRHIDYATSLIKSDVDINVCMIGFGKPNQQIFLTSIANNQFITQAQDGVALKPVTYHIFDKDVAENNKNLNHSYYRFRNEGKEMYVKDYLPLPTLPANESYYRLDINDPEYYNEIRKIISKSKSDVNFVIVSFESDLENIDMAQKLVEKRREWGIENFVIFVRAIKSHNDHFIFKEENVLLIGNESKCVYDIEQIVSDKFFRMAQMRNEIYDLEYAITTDKNFVLNKETILQNRAKANKNWFTKKSQLERESSLYCCLSLQSRLNLMGLEYCKIDDNDLQALTENEYINYYAKEDLPDTHTYGIEVDGKKIINYTLNFPQSRRRNLAVLEHLRWNSFMLSKGMIPASKKQILDEQIEVDGRLKHTNGKNYRLRRHGNLTTFDGLVEFRQMVAKRDQRNETDCDVIKYDYQLLDDAYWLLTKNGYKIIQK